MAPLRTREIRGANVAYLAQSAAATFNPAITIGEQVTESAVLHGIFTQKMQPGAQSSCTMHWSCRMRTVLVSGIPIRSPVVSYSG